MLKDIFEFIIVIGEIIRDVIIIPIIHTCKENSKTAGILIVPILVPTFISIMKSIFSRKNVRR